MIFEDRYIRQVSERQKTGEIDEHDWSAEGDSDTLRCNECSALYCADADSPEGSEYLCRQCHPGEDIDEDAFADDDEDSDEDDEDSDEDE